MIPHTTKERSGKGVWVSQEAPHFNGHASFAQEHHCFNISPMAGGLDSHHVWATVNTATVNTSLSTSYFGHLMQSWLIGKDPDAGRDRGQEEKGMTGWDGWMASLTQWTWVWVNSGSWWWTGRPGVLRFMGSQRVRHDWATELNWIEVHLGASISLG